MSATTTIDKHVEQTEAVVVFTQLFALLEDYAPMWYTEEMHDRASAALLALQEPKAAQ